ncbi:MAG TPA: peptidylprolyl isomerase [Acidimicrobiales bacterium]|nr:peptidylprolyl isomerase [Acidimicrobiales bacterium]
MPSEKRSRQREAREARLAAEAQQQKRHKQIRNTIIGVVVIGIVVGIVFLVSGGSSPPAKSSGSTTTTTAAGKTGNAKLQAEADEVAVKAGCPASPKTPTAAASQKYTAAPAMSIDTTKQYTATFKTTAGTFDATLDATAAPKTVNNFVFLANKGYFNCGAFFRVIPGFVLQTGNPAQTNAGTEPGYTIPDELPPKATPQYPLGSLVMANTGQPNTGGSQFFVVSGPQGESLPNTYSLFGQVTTPGLSVVSTIDKQGSTSGIPPAVTQRIISVTINES